MGKCIDLTGERFGRLVVLKRHHKDKHRNFYWLCKCDCGNETFVQSSNLKNGNVKSLKTVDVEWIKGKDGRMTLNEVEGSEKIWNADLVLIAMGFTGVEDYIANDLGVELNNRGSINATDVDYKTSKKKVFVAGDARRGPSLVVWGITEGRNAALSVDKYLME